MDSDTKIKSQIAVTTQNKGPYLSTKRFFLERAFQKARSHDNRPEFWDAHLAWLHYLKKAELIYLVLGYLCEIKENDPVWSKKFEDLIKKRAWRFGEKRQGLRL